VKSLLKNILFVTLPSLLVTLLLFELVFRFILPAANQPDYFFDEQYGILRFNTESNTEGVFSTGKLTEHCAHWRINNAGWNNPVNYTAEKPAGTTRIAIIGDSYVEALNVNQTEMFGVRLQEQLGKNFQVYTFGVSGSPFSQYLQMSRYIQKEYNPDVYVFTVIHNDFDESIAGKSIGPFYHTLRVEADSLVTEVRAQPYQASGVRRLLKRSALIRYLLFNIKINETIASFRSKSGNNDTAQQFNANVNVNEVTRNQASIRKAMAYIGSTLQKELAGKKIIFIIDGSRYDIYEDKLNSCNVCYMNDLSMATAADNGFTGIDLNNVFAAEYAQKKQAFNTPEDFHWNPYGHQLVADTLTRFFIIK
jgi:hypothetical protein